MAREAGWEARRRGKKRRKVEVASAAPPALPHARPPLHIAVYGDFTMGKSHFLAGLPKPLVVWMFDGAGKETPYFREDALGLSDVKLRSKVYHDKRETPYRIVEHHGDPIVRVEIYRDPNVNEPKAFFNFLDRLGKFAAEQGKYRSGVLDSATFGTLLARKWAQFDDSTGYGEDTKDPRRLYAFATDQAETVLCVSLPGLTDFNIGVAMHVSRDKLRVGDEKVGVPLAPGRVQEMIGAAWPELYHIYIDRDEQGKKIRRLQTEADDRWMAATQIGAPDGSRARYEALWKNAEMVGKKRVTRAS